MGTRGLLVLCLSIAAALLGTEARAYQRAFVASTGNDANVATGCVVTLPCRGFAAAITVVDPGGEIVALDGAGFGAVTIDKSVTITGNPGYYAGIFAGVAGVDAVTISGSGAKVVLRGLNLNGNGNQAGVVFLAGTSLSIENCVISNFVTGALVTAPGVSVRIADTIFRADSDGINIKGSGETATISRVRIVDVLHAISVFPSAGEADVTISDSILSGNGPVNSVAGILATSAAAGVTTRVSVAGTTISYFTNGILAIGDQGTTAVTASANLITGNQTGMNLVAGTGATTLRSAGDNTLDQNGTDVSGVTPFSKQ